MAQTAATIHDLVDEQMAAIADAEMRKALQRFLITPECQERNWDYGHDGERYPCWLVARFPATDTALVYCEHGFGPDFPWGIVTLGDEWMGPDGAWHFSLQRAFCNTHEGARWTASGPDAPPPAPVEALPLLLAAVRTHSIVGLGEMHGSATEHELIRALVSHVDFSADLVIEFGNALYQDVLDAYISGEDVPLERLKHVWRNTTQSPINTWDHPIYAQLLATIRDANRMGRDIRVLAGDPPIDWAKVHAVEDWLSFTGSRDTHYAVVVEQEVLRRGRRALLLIGGMHLVRQAAGSVGARFPSMPVIMPHGGYGARNEEVEEVASSWPVPSISPVAGTRLARFTMAHFLSGALDGAGKPKQFPPWRWDELFDYYLYLGPAASLRLSQWPTPEPEFEVELERRRRIVHQPGGIPKLP